MIAARWRALPWVALYLALATGPLLVAWGVDAPPSRSTIVEIASGLGYVGLSLLSLQFALGARGRRVVDALGLDAVLLFHRQTGLWAAAFSLGHVLLMVIAEPFYVVYLLDPRAGPPRGLALGFVPVGLLLLVLVPRQLSRLRIPYEIWRVAHAALALMVACIGVWHVRAVGRAMATEWKRDAVTAFVAVALCLLIVARVLRPAMVLGRPWRVVEVRKERARVWTVVLEAIGHEGLVFRPGQSVWLTLGRSPFSPRQHPFTVASSAASPRRVELTIKELGDFTSTIGRVAVGTRAFLDGPYGAFALDLEHARPLVCVAGGIGVTPMMSMLRTLRDLGDRRPALLVYGNGSGDKIVFGAELDELARTTNLRVVHVLEHPPPGWRGESGLIGGEIFDRHLGEAWADADHFVCGPEPMMNAVEEALHERGVRADRIHTEYFVLVGSRPPGRRSIRERHVRLLGLGVAVLLLAAVLVMAAVRGG